MPSALARRWTTPAVTLGQRRAATTLQVMLLLAVLSYATSTVPGVRAQPGFHSLLDGWLQPTAYCLAALLLVLRPACSSVDRGLWTLIAAALCLRAAAFVVYLAVVRHLHPIPYPSAADVGWLSMSVLLLMAMVGLARSRFRGLSTTLVLDGVLGACATAALIIACSSGLDVIGDPTQAATLTNVLYPALDVLLLLLVLGVLLAYEWNPPPAVWILGAGVAGFAVLDSVFVFQVVQGEFTPGSWLSGLSLVSTAAISFSAWARPGRPNRGRHDYLPGLILPGLLSLACLGVLVWSSFQRLPVLTVVLATVGLAAAIARTGRTFRDVSTLARVRLESRTDELTRLPNRRAFNEALAAALDERQKSQPLALLVLDLDGFKDVNDSMGHHRGDELLALVASRLHLALRTDDLVARIGGDEFAVLLRGAGITLAEEVAGRLRAGCRGPYTIANRLVTVGVSVGIAVFPDHGTEAVALLQHADVAMYDAKDARVGQSVYRADRHRASKARLESTAELQKALDEDQFVLHYQPQVRLSDGQVVGVEALVRWQHPIDGLRPPATFLQQAESGRLMRQLTLCVLRQALAQLVVWREAGVDTVVAVNLSVTDLLDREFPSQVDALLEEFQVPGRSLVLELTEDLLLADPSRGHKVIADLAQRQVLVQVDDYGTGYSTLGYLRDLPAIGGLKLDRSFVTDLDTDSRALAIVESTIGLARSLGLALIAEGVETTAVRDRLTRLGCELAQGYLFARPVPGHLVSFAPVRVQRTPVR